MAATPEDHDVATGLRTHSTSPEKTIFTEPNNSDGWLATDFTVEVRR